jgi:hypothetical protein
MPQYPLIDIDQIVPVYCAAMLKGFADAEVLPYIDRNLPPYIRKTVYFGGESNGKFDPYLRVEDTWKVTKSGLSSGITTVFHDTTPLWEMHYQGWYKKAALPFLKEALRENFEKGLFFGGRGPRIYTNSSLKFQYVNYPGENNWKYFRSSEQICVIGGNHEVMGFHDCHGMLLYSPDGTLPELPSWHKSSV